jgi:hypothetical protein
VELRIGVTHSPKELVLDLGETGESGGVKSQIEGSLASGGVLWIKDHKGREVGVPVDKIAYVDIGSPDAERRIGFAGG